MWKIKKIITNKKGLNKEDIVILNNIELISFIDSSKMEEYKKFLINEISKFNKYEKFKKFWLKKVIKTIIIQIL